MKRFLPYLVIFAAVTGTYLGGFLTSFDHALSDMAFKLLKREASQQLVVVEIDSRSLKELDSWPWPRRYHAEIIDRLMAAGARDVALDIDFSSRSNPTDDTALSSAIGRSNGHVILPVFKQFYAPQGQEPQIVYSAPHPSVGKDARLATVNIRVEPDGRVRRYLTADEWQGATVTSMAGLLATGRQMTPGAFHIDLGIQPETLPRLSYIDVIRGDFLNETVAGKKVIVGATAVELGDQLAVATHNVIPGPILQALAFESIVQNRMIYRISQGPVVAIALLIAVFLGPFLGRKSWRIGLASGGGIILLCAGTSVGTLAVWPILVDTSPWLLVTLLSYTVSLWRAIDAQSLSLFQQRLDAMHRRAMMKSVVDDSFDGIAIVNQEGEIELINPAGELIIGTTADKAVGSPIHSFLPWSPGLEALYGLADGQPADDIGASMFGPEEFSMSAADGQALVIELIVSSSRLSMSRQRREKDSRDTRVFIYTFRDITQRKQIEAEQKRAREQAEAANRTKTEFLANMSHELRTPLNAVIGFSDIIRKEAMGPAGVPQYVEYAQDINNSGVHLLEIINDILDMSKIEAGELQPNLSEFQFNRIVGTSFKLISDRAGKDGVGLISDVPDDLPSLVADERMIKQILINLLSNAVKFTPEGGTVTLSAQATEDGFTFSVADTGIGIPADKMEVILEPFGQADSRLERAYEGTGLGLPLVKSMTELHGGILDIQSTEGEGTVATIRLPRECIVAAPAQMTG